MSFSTTAFAVGTLIARKEKVTGSAATQAGLLMGVGGMTPVGVVLAQSSIRSARRRQRASELGTAGGEGVSSPPPPPPPTPPPSAAGTPSATAITADDLKAALAEGFAQFGKQMDAQNAKLLAAIAALAASIDAQTAASAPPKKSAS